MTHTELYITWALLVALLLAVASLARAVEHGREELEEFRQHMMGEKPNDPDVG
jgi:hypothetical protein